MFPDGGADRDRTCDLLNAIQTLYQLSYDPNRSGCKSKTSDKIVKINFSKQFHPGATRTIEPLADRDESFWGVASIIVTTRGAYGWETRERTGDFSTWLSETIAAIAWTMSGLV